MKQVIRVLSYAVAILAGFAISQWMYSQQGGVDKLNQIAYLVDSRFIGEYDPKQMGDAAAEAMIDSLGDRWSYYATAEDYRSVVEQQQNAYVGIGVTIIADEQCRGFEIIDVNPKGSAMQAGLEVGDIVIRVNDTAVQESTVNDLRGMIRGKEGTAVQITVLRGEETLTLEVKRMKIETAVVESQMIGEAVGYIRVLNFDSRSAQESIAAIEALREQGAKSVLFDVRNNPGGYASELVKLLDYLLPEGDLFRAVDYTGKETLDRSDAAFLDMPMAVLCNENSYSAAEFFAAAIQEYGAGKVIGMPTCGKGYFQYTFELMDGSAIGLSVGKYYTPNGVSLAGVGIQPDIQVEVTPEQAAEIYYSRLDPSEDPQIQAALDALRTKEK